MIAVAGGMTRATLTTWRTQRASHLGSRFGHCSNRPKTSIAVNPRSTVRTTADIGPDFQWAPIIRPQAIEKRSTNRRRRQSNINAKPLGFAGTAGAIMAEDSLVRQRARAELVRPR